MNNLKRVLSLALSGIMLVGMMAIGASAAEFTDADKIEHDDAVNILVALSVINGKDDGSFDPQGNVTRAEMAKMIAVAMNGGKDTNTGVKGTPTFTDIKGHWAESYIEYCYDMGIISGRGDGTFDPGANVTGLEATKMVLTALGYDSVAYKLTGASWAVRTDELAKTANPNLYEELGDVVMANNASRDTAAQLIWNGLQNWTKRVTPQQNTSTGEVTFVYGDGKGTLLKERYDADIVIGTYVGNNSTGAGGEKGEIALEATVSVTANGNTSYREVTYNFPSDMGIENIGEEIKVIYKDSKDGKSGPDRKDTIFGVFNTGKTEVYNVTLNDIQDAESDSKIKFNDTKYDVVTGGVKVVKNFITSKETKVPATAFNAKDGDWRKQSVDTVKFICDDSGKIERAYVVNYNVARVTAVTASKITLSDVGSLDIADHDIYTGAAKDDVVVYTKFYSETKADATYAVTKAESVEGELTGYKGAENVVVEKETYKVNGKALKDVTDDPIVAIADDAKIGDTVKVYLLNGMAVAMQSLEKTGGNYAVITDVDVTNKDGLTSTLNPWRVTILSTDNTKETYAVHKDSVSDGEKKAVTSDDLEAGSVIDYSISGGKVKIKEVFAPKALTASSEKVWDKTTKKFAYYDGATETSAVAAANATLFVGVLEKDEKGDPTDKYDDFYVYSLRDLNNIANSTTKVVGVEDKGLVSVGFAALAEKPGSNTADTVYGIVKSLVGTRKVNDETKYEYTVALTNGETISVYVDSDKVIEEYEIVKFDQTNDNVYGDKAFTDLIKANAAVGKSTWTIVAVDSYSSNILTYFTGTSRADATKPYTGSGKGTITADKDVDILYVNYKAKTAGDDIGVSQFDSSTGYPNALIHTNSDGIVDIIIVETSRDEKNMDAENFGKAGAAVELKTITAVDAVADTHGKYTAAVDPAKPEVGADFTVTVTCEALDAKNSSETVSVTYNDQKETVTFSEGKLTGTVSFKAVESKTEITLAAESQQAK